MKYYWKKIGLITLSSSALLLAACADDSEADVDASVDGEEISIPYVPWESEIASTYVVGEVLEEIGYDVDLVSTDLAVLFQSVAEGQADATLSVWMPESQVDLWEEHEENFVHVGTSMEGAGVGLAVPEYMDVDSIEDLTDESDQTIVGIEAGAGVVRGAEEAVETYDNLEDWSVSTSSAGALTTELSTAVESEEDIVVTGWSPHWKFLVYDLKYLEDSENIFGEAETIETIGREGLEEDHPVAYGFLENFHWEVSDMEAVMLDMQEGASSEEAAANFVEDNPEKVDEWTDGLEDLVE